MRKFLLFIVMAAVMAGCVPVQQQTPIVLLGDPINDADIYHDKRLPSGYVTLRNPEIGKVKKVDVGVNMYEKTYRIDYDTYKLSIKTEATVEVPGATLNTYNNDIQYDLYAWGKDKHKAFCALLIRANRKVCLVDPEDSGYFNYAAYGNLDHLYKLGYSIKYETEKMLPRYDSKSFRYIALYQGYSDGTAKISFREFFDNTARPAFTQDISYQLNKKSDTIVGFKGLRIRIISADNTSITYEILKDYDENTE